MSRQRRIPTPAWQHDRGVGGGFNATRVQIYGGILIGLLVAVAIAIVGYGFLSEYIDDQKRPHSTAINVDGYNYDVEQYTNRAKVYIESIGGSTGYSIIIPSVNQQLIEDALLLKSAPGELGAEPTQEEIREQIATLLGITKDDPNFDARFQEELAKTGMADHEYTDMARAAVLKTKMTEKFTNELPATIESVHYRQIQVATQAEADEIKTQLENGGDFATIAAEKSTDTATKDKGGDAGWAPKGYLGEALEGLLFGLEPGVITTYPTQSSVYVFEVIEKDDARAIDDDKKAPLAATAYGDWLTEKNDAVSIKNDMDLQSGNGDKLRYVIDHAGLTAQ